MTGSKPAGKWPRWRLVAMLYADGQETQEIAPQLGLTVQTVKAYVRTAKRRILYGYGTKLDLRRELIARGWLQP